jgi:hypothetical protein
MTPLLGSLCPNQLWNLSNQERCHTAIAHGASPVFDNTNHHGITATTTSALRGRTS